MKKIRRRTLAVFGVAALSGAALLHVSQNVQQAEDRLSKYERQYESEHEAVRVLNAEWAYLNSPSRLEGLAQDYLDLGAPEAGQMMPDMSVLPEAPTSTYAPQSLYQNISRQEEIAEKALVIPAPKRKPKSQKGDFGALLKKVGKGDAQ